MQPTIAAALAVVAALAEFTIVPYLQIGDAVLQPVLVFGAIWTVVGGLEAGLVWAFVGGLVLDVLSQRPLGVSAFSLLIAMGAAFLVGSALRRIRIAAPIAAAAAASVVYSMLLLLVTSLMHGSSVPDGAIATVAPTALYATVAAAVFGPLAAAIVIRRAESERLDW